MSFVSTSAVHLGWADLTLLLRITAQYTRYAAVASFSQSAFEAHHYTLGTQNIRTLVLWMDPQVPGLNMSLIHAHKSSPSVNDFSAFDYFKGLTLWVPIEAPYQEKYCSKAFSLILYCAVAHLRFGRACLLVGGHPAPLLPEEPGARHRQKVSSG